MADNNTDLSLNNAKWFAQQLGNYSSEEQATLLRTKDFGEFERIAGPVSSSGLWQGRIDWQNQAAQGARIPIAAGKAPPAKGPGQGVSPGGVVSAGVGAGALLLSRKPDYDKFKKNADEYAKKSADEWEKRQRKKPDLSKFKSKQEAYEAGQRYMHDNIALFYESQANDWAKTHGDSAIAAALDRKKVQHEVYRKNKKWTYQDYKNTVKGYAERAASDWDKDPFRSVGRQQTYDAAERDIHDTFVRSNLSGKQAKQWAAQYNDPGLNAAIERKRLQDESEAIKNQGRISKALGRNPAAKFAPASLQPTTTAWTPLPPNTLGVGKPSELQGVQTPTTAPKASNFKGRARSLRSRFSPKAKRLIKDALSYLQRLFKRSFIGSLIGAAGSLLSAAIAGTIAIATAAIGIISHIIGIITAKIVTITTFIVTFPVLPVVVIVAVVIIVIVFFFPHPPEVGQFEGITYSIVAPESVENRQNITYQIVLIYDPAVANYSLEELTLVANIPLQTTFVSATGVYDTTSEPGKIKWKLTSNLSGTGNGDKESFYFQLTIDPEDNIDVTNNIYLDGLSYTGSPPGAVAPNDNTCEGNYSARMSRNYLLPKNFGDPDCTLDTFEERNNLYVFLNQIDPQWVDFWFDVIIPSESGYSPNAWGCRGWDPNLKECTGSPQKQGAWGLFQMGSSRPPGSMEDRNGPRGDVTWQEQADNAVSRNNMLENQGHMFWYWSTAKHWCQKNNGENLGMPQCRDFRG